MSRQRLTSLWRGHELWASTIVAIRLAVAATWVLQAFASAHILGALVRPVAGAALFDAIAPATIMLATALLVRPVLQILGQLAAHRAMSVVKRGVRIRALHALVQRSARDPRGRSGADHALVVDGVEHLDAYLTGYLPQLAVSVVVTAVVGSVMVVIDPWAGAAAVVVALAVPLVPRLWGRVLAGRGGDQWAAYETLQAEFVDSMHGMTTLVAFGAEARRERQLQAASSALLERTIAQLRLSLVDSGLAAFALAAAPAAVLIALALGARVEASTTVFLLVLLSIELVRPLRDLAALWHAGYVGTFSGRAILRLLEDAPPESRAGQPDPERAMAAPHSVGSISVDGLVVRHPGADGDALHIAMLTFGRGTTAIVGPSGAGKSTLAAALVGLVEPERGAVAIDGVVMRPERLLREVSLVPQDPALFGGTIADEIGRGDRGADASAVAEAATAAGIGTDDQRIGLGTVVGEGGALLSGGQRQRVAIARALVQGRGVLVLDEATSALDPASEAKLLRRLQRDRDRVLIAVTHRADVMAVADRVVTIDAGALAHEGRSDRRPVPGSLR